MRMYRNVEVTVPSPTVVLSQGQSVINIIFVLFFLFLPFGVGYWGPFILPVLTIHNNGMKYGQPLYK